MAAMIGCLGFVYSAIFKLELSLYLPLMATSFICWVLIATIVNESATVFIENESYIRSSSMPRSTFIYKMLMRNVLLFAHNAILIPIIMVIFGIEPHWTLPLLLISVGLVLINGVWLAMLLGILCIRYRDLSPMVGNLVQIAFFASPIIWGRMQLDPQYGYLIDYNPFAIFLELLRQPILGTVPEAYYWIAACVITVCGIAITIPFYAKFRPRVAFYV